MADMEVDTLSVDREDVTLSELDGIRYLHFGTHWIQGAMRISRPHDLVLTYTQQMMTWLLFHQVQKEESIAILGLGAGSLLRYCMKHTASSIHTVEINPRVTAMCRSFFRLPENKRSQIYHQDAEQWVRDSQHVGSYKVLMVDLYDAAAEGPVCSSLDFYQNCYHCLDERGLMTVNLFGAHHSYEENIDRIAQVFHGNVLVLPEIEEGNVVILAFKGDYLAQTTTAQLIEQSQRVQEQYKLPARRWAKAILADQP